ncbi:MAG: hypothetical protein HYZ29_08605 [Myxococcales bacterium]|nr:hypothetical protein [Myxococcales bacterium]
MPSALFIEPDDRTRLDRTLVERISSSELPNVVQAMMAAIEDGFMVAAIKERPLHGAAPEALPLGHQHEDWRRPVGIWRRHCADTGRGSFEVTTYEQDVAKVYFEQGASIWRRDVKRYGDRAKAIIRGKLDPVRFPRGWQPGRTWMTRALRHQEAIVLAQGAAELDFLMRAEIEAHKDVWGS